MVKPNHFEQQEVAGNDISRLLESGSNELARSLYEEFYTPDRDLERISLMIDELLLRADEGMVVLRHLSSGSDELGIVVGKVIEQKSPNLDTVSSILGIERLNNVLNLDKLSKIEVLRKAHAHALERGYTRLSFRECMQREESLRARDHYFGIPGHISGSIESTVFQLEATFGAAEPTYLELLGPRNILDIRERGKQDALLLGSYGKYSASEFERFCGKFGRELINPNVIDIDSLSIQLIREDRREDTKTKLAQADAAELPYRAGSISSIYTNYLFHHIQGPDGSRESSDRVKKVFEEAYRVLRPGGEMVLMERPWGRHRDNIESFIRSIRSMALSGGFIIEQQRSRMLYFELTAEAGGSAISDNGFPRYGDSLIAETGEGSESVALKLRKPASS